MSKQSARGAEAAPTPRPGPGRPVDQAKRDAILKETRRLLLHYGINVTLESVAAAAGVSRQTIYNSWPNKESLFAAVIERMSDEVLQSLSSAPAEESVETTLTRLAQAYANALLDPERLAIFRLVVSSPDSHGPAFFAAGPARAMRLLSEYLRRQAERGVLDLEDPELAAEHFMGMLKGNYFLKVLLNGPSAIDPHSHERRIASTVTTFLRAYGKRQ